jgi:hypothetical protein
MMDDATREAVRFDYEQRRDLTLVVIAEKHGTTVNAISMAARRYGWNMRGSLRSADRADMIERLMRLLERQIAHLELHMQGNDEKEAALLGGMARALEKLIELDGKAGGRKTGAKRSRDFDEMRKLLQARIEHLRKK